MTQYNVALRVGYNGSAVSRGAIRNANDLRTLTNATNTQGTASETAARKNTSLVSSFYAMSGVVSTFAVIGLGRQLVSDAAASELLTTRINNLAGSSERAAEVQDYLRQTAGNLNTRYSILADSYARLIVLENQRTLTTQESRQVLEGMSNVAKSLGATNVQVQQSMYGLTQALTQGTVQAQELNQVIEPLPGLLQSLDKAAGLPANGFRELVKEGKVSSEFLKTTLINAFKDFEGAAQANKDTISASFANLGTQYDFLVKRLEQPINSAITPVINTLADSLEYVEQNVEVLDNLTFAFGALATVLAGRVVGALSSSTIALTRKIQALDNAVIAERKAALSAVAAAKAEVQKTQSIQAGAQRQLAAAQTDYQRAAALNNLARANATATLASNNLKFATAQYNTVARTATVTARALNGAMGLLGGPAGVITIAALSLLSFASSASDAGSKTEDLTSKTKALNEEQAKLNPFRNYTKNMAETALQRYEVMLETAQKMASEAITRVNNSDSQVDLFYLNEAEKELENITKKVTQLRAQLSRFDESANDSGNDESGESDTNDELQSALTRLQDSLLTREESIRQSYIRRSSILDNALNDNLISEQVHEELSKRLIKQNEAEITEFHESEQQKRIEAENERREKEQRDLEIEYENKLAVIQGFYDRKALLEYQQEQRILDAQAEQRILAAQGFADQEEKDRHAREQRVFDAEYRRTGVMQQLLFSRAEWERKNELEKTESILDIGEFGFKQMAGQSKKAFAMYKAFSIAKAIMNTYEMATGAFNALAPIPIVGPVLAPAAAAAAIAYGLNQVRTIKNQQYAAQYHGGRDYIPAEQTALLQEGERVVSPRQNVALTKAVDVINRGGAGQGNMVIHYAPQIHLDSANESAFEQAAEFEQMLYRRFEAQFISQFRNRSGDMYSAVRGVA